MKSSPPFRPSVSAASLRLTGAMLVLATLGSPAIAQNVANGKALYEQSFCVICHGDNPGANINNIRNGANNPAAFLAACTSRDPKYRDMAQICRGFSAEQAADIAAFIASFPPVEDEAGGCSLVSSRRRGVDPVLLALLACALIVLTVRRR
jgi:cytochrome c553